MSAHLQFEPLKCIGCNRCEVACGHLRDEGYTVTSASLMLYRAEEKKNFFGLLYKTQAELVAARPDGMTVTRQGEAQEGGGSPAAKPILLRPPCDACDPAPCVRSCPTGAIRL